LRKAEEDPNITIVSAPQIRRALRFYPSRLRQKLEADWLASLEKAVSQQITAVWLFENSRFFDMRFAGDRLKIYHQVDLNQNFNPHTAARTADICFCTTDIIRSQLLQSQEKVFKIHHGLAMVDDCSRHTLTPEQNSHYARYPVNAVYVGNLEMRYLDVCLLRQVVESFPRIGFHLVGGYDPHGELHETLRSVTNVNFWGKVDYRLIPNILEKADVLLVTYREEHHRDQASPHKFMEYLHSGKVIVSTYSEEYRNLQELVQMVDRNNDFLEAFSVVVNDLDFFNSDEFQQRRITFSQGKSYENQIRLIEKTIKSCVH
jgi:glycosyltransferase involved in cell wall biosynthesis